MILGTRARSIVVRLAGAAAVAGALSFFPWTAAGRAAGPTASPRAAFTELQDLGVLLPADALLIAEARGLGPAARELVTGAMKRRMIALPAWKQFKKSPPYAQLLAGMTFVELTAGMPVGDLLATLLGEQLVVAVLPAAEGAAEPGLVAAARAADADHAEQLIRAARALIAMSKEEPKPGRADTVDGIDVVVLRDRLWIGAVGRDLIAASSAARFRDLARQAQGGGADRGGADRDGADRDGADHGTAAPAALSPLLASTRARSPQDALLTAALDVKRLAATLPSGLAIPDLQDNAGGALLTGDLIRLAKNADVLRASLRSEGDGLVLDLAVPRDPAAPLPAAFRCFAHAEAMDPLPLLRPPETLLTSVMRRDWAAFWSDHGELCSAAAEAGFVEAKTGFGVLFGGKSLPDDLLPALDQPFLFVLARQSFAGIAPPPEVRYPAGALVWRTKPGQAGIGAAFESAVLGGIALANFDAAEKQKTKTPYQLFIEDHRGVRVLGGRVAPEAVAVADRGALNVAPCFAQVDDWLIAASSRELLTQLIDELLERRRDPAHGEFAPAGALTFIEVAGAAGARLVAEDRAAFISNGVLNEGKTQEAAEFETGALLDLLGQLDRARLMTRLERDALHVELSLCLIEQPKPAATPREGGP